MRVPLSWLREYVDIPVSPEELADQLTNAGMEVASVDYVGVQPPAQSAWAPDLSGPTPPQFIPWDPEKVVVGELLEVTQHPNADRLTVPVVGYGDGKSIAVVTGAPNIKVGMQGQKVVLALAGAKLIDGHSDTRKWITLKPGKLRGVVSEGMVCSELELGLSDEHEGILFLPDDAPVGTPLRDYLGDVVLEIELTTNLARALSILGMAREVGAVLGQPVRAPEPQLEATGPSIEGRAKVTITDPEDCPRFAVGLIEGIAVGESPLWMQQRLRLAGMRPISNVVDVSNYVMLELGQPSHTFDADLVVDRHLIVRRATADETLRTLDNQDRKLNAAHIVVADASGPESLAGVMGGLETEVTERTTNILLEAAIWNSAQIRRTVQTFKLPSEASRRFERGVDPELPPLALRRALQLMREVAGGTVAAGIVDVYPRPWQQPRIELTSAEVRRLLGIELSAAEIADYLRRLGFECEVGVDSVLALVPSYRLDVSIAADLVEEVARLYGYDRLPTTRLSDELPPQYSDPRLVGQRDTKDILVAAGLQEVITYSLTGPDLIEAFDGARPHLNEYVQLENPLTPERAVMRCSILPELTHVLANNLRERPRVALFEVGAIYQPRMGEVLPDEPLRLAIVMAGQRERTSWLAADAPALDFFDIKGVVQTLLERLKIAHKVSFTPASDPHFHPGRSAFLVDAEGRNLGVLGELHPDVRARVGLTVGRAAAAELDLETLLQLREPLAYSTIYRQPVTYQDIAVVAPIATSAEQIRGLIAQTAGALLERVELFDVYTGAPIPEGQRSLAYRMSFRAQDRTLSDAEISKIREKVARRLQHEVGATSRS